MKNIILETEKQNGESIIILDTTQNNTIEKQSFSMHRRTSGSSRVAIDSNMALDSRSEWRYMNMKVINNLLDEINNDRTVPKNIRTIIQRVRADLNNEKNDTAVRINSGVSLLDEVSNDPNIPIYTRTQIWNIVSMLEVINEKAKLER